MPLTHTSRDASHTFIRREAELHVALENSWLSVNWDAAKELTLNYHNKGV